VDRFTRIYTIVIALVIIGALVLWVGSAWKPGVWELNRLLESDPQLATYPYQFRVVSLDSGVATISTPRSFELPAIRFLEIIHPNLANKADNDPEVVAAQQTLIDHQKRAQGLILAQPQVESVRWELDTQWLAARGVYVSGSP
jgi:TRAP-type C4-dicarboxylate transport system permease small subunit